MITLHDDGSSPNTEKVRILLAELGLRYAQRLLDLASGATRTPELTAKNPNQKVPILEDEDGVVVWESGAILLYLADKHGRFLPRGGQERARVLELMFFEANAVAATLGGPGGIADHARRPPAERNAAHVAELQREITRQAVVLDRVLADGRPFLAGDYSVADMQLYPALRRGVGYGVIQASALLAPWLERVGSREAVRAATATPKGTPRPASPELEF